MTKYKVSIDRDKCIGCGVCVSLLEDYFDFDDNDGLVRLERSVPKGKYFVLEINESQVEEFKKAAQECPTNVIIVNK